MYKIIILSLFSSSISALDNGLALTPPMGWMHWERYRCITDCTLYPNDCISEKLFKNLSTLMVTEGYLDLGYEYFIIDDCWLAPSRDENNKLRADPDRFPSGIENLIEFVHSLGLKFGIYEDLGTHTCAGYPGSLDHLELDARTFAEWGVDYLKLDGCYFNGTDAEMIEGYANMSRFLQETARPIVFSCSFPAYQGIDANLTAAVQYCNLWRNYGDVQDSWASVADIMNFFKNNQEKLIQYAGPGHWNDPDMLIVGNFGLSLDQSIAQMIMWSILSAPLILSVDLSRIRPEFKEILQNRAAITINQSPLGIPAVYTETIDDIDIWFKKCTDNRFALGFISNRVDGYPYRMEVFARDFGLNDRYDILNVFENSIFPDIYGPNDEIVFRVNPTGGVLLLLVRVP